MMLKMNTLVSMIRPINLETKVTKLINQRVDKIQKEITQTNP